MKLDSLFQSQFTPFFFLSLLNCFSRNIQLVRDGIHWQEVKGYEDQYFSVQQKIGKTQILSTNDCFFIPFERRF